MGECRCTPLYILNLYTYSPICVQIDAIVRDFGLVVISRSGSNPEKFIYESDQLSRLKVYYKHLYIHHV